MRAFTDDDVPWLHGVVESLERDGLAAVAEERAPYGSDGGESGGTRVGLP